MKRIEMEPLKTLYVYELKKIVCRRLVWITLGIMLLLCVFLSFADLLGTSFAYSETDGGEEITVSGYEWMQITKECARELSGRKLDDTLFREMQEASRGNVESRREMWKYNILLSYVNEIQYGFDMQLADYVHGGILHDDEQADMADAAGFYAERNRQIGQFREDQMLTKGELDYWKEKDAGIQVPFTYEYMEGWENLWNQACVLNYMLFLLLAVSLSQVFSAEHLRRMDAMILCSQYGKRELYFAKMLAGVTFGLVSALLLFGAAVISNVAVYGADGLHGAIQLAFPLSSWNVSMGVSVLVLLFLLLCISVLYSIGVMFLSEWMKKTAGVMAVPIGMMCFTMLVNIPYRFRMASQIYDLLPTNLLMTWELWIDRLVCVFGKYLTSFQIAPVAYAMASVVLLLLGKRMYQRYQVGGVG